MSLKTSIQYIGIGLQSAKGSPNTTPDVYVKFLEGTFPTEMDVTHLRESGDDELIVTSIKNVHREKFTFKCIARPQIAAYLLAYFLGKDTTTGGADPYTHTIIRSAVNERAWLTIRRKITTNIVQQLDDCRIEKITIEGEAGKEILFTVEGNALTASIDTTEDTPSYEATSPFVFYQSQGAFKVATVVDTNIKSFSIALTIASQEGMQTDGILINDLPDLKLDIDFSATFFAASEAYWKKANYNNTTAPAEDLYTSAFEFLCKYTENVADDRQFKMTIKDIVWQPVALDPVSEPAIIEETVAGIVRKPAAGSIVEAIIKNSIATYIYHS